MFIHLYSLTNRKLQYDEDEKPYAAGVRPELRPGRTDCGGVRCDDLDGGRTGRPSPTGSPLAPDGFRDFLARDFGYEDKFYLVGHSDPSTDFPYVLPGPADTWGGTWPTSGWRTHEVNILFGLDEQPDDDCLLAVDLADYAKRFPPLVKVSVNGQDAWFRLNRPPTIRPAAGRRYGQQEPTVDTLSLTGRFERATPRRLEMPLRRGTLRKGGNTVHVTVLEGSWILFDRVALEGPSSVRPTQSEGLFVRDVAAAPYESDHDGKRVQPLLVNVEWLGATPTLSVEIDGPRTLQPTRRGGPFALRGADACRAPRPDELLPGAVRRTRSGLRMYRTGSPTRANPGRLRRYAHRVRPTRDG